MGVFIGEYPGSGKQLSAAYASEARHILDYDIRIA